MAEIFLSASAQPFFKGTDAGTILPIKTTGTKLESAFELDFRDQAKKRYSRP